MWVQWYFIPLFCMINSSTCLVVQPGLLSCKIVFIPYSICPCRYLWMSATLWPVLQSFWSYLFSVSFWPLRRQSSAFVNLSGYRGCNLTMVYNIEYKQYLSFTFVFFLILYTLSHDVLLVMAKNIQNENVTSPAINICRKILWGGIRVYVYQLAQVC